MRFLQICLCYMVAILPMGCGKVPTPEPGRKPITVRNDFEQKQLEPFHFLVPNEAINLSFLSWPATNGGVVLKNYHRPGDFTFNGYRVELATYGSAPFHSEVFYAFKFMLDSTYSDWGFNLVCQWQDLPNYDQGESWTPSPILRGSPPPVALVLTDHSLMLKMNEATMSAGETFTVGNSLPLEKMKWYEVKAHMFWSDDAKGYVEVFINGKALTPFANGSFKFYHRNLLNRAGNYFKFGQYRGKVDVSSPQTIYFDNIRIGSTEQDIL